MDRRATLGKSKTQLVMTRIGELVAAANLLILLPILPVLLVYLVVHKFVGAFTAESSDRREYEPSIGT